MKELVIDVSHCDPNIDIGEWKRRRGIFGVIVKCGGYEDIGAGYPEQFQLRLFERHYNSTVSNGLHVGVYYYSVATDVETARQNADHCASIIDGHYLDLPVYLDIEDRGQLSIGKRQLTDVILAFIRRMNEHGYKAGCYTYRSMLHECMYADELEPYPLWIAEYSDECHTSVDHNMWQFGGMDLDGDVTWDDLPGYVDANWLYYDYSQEGRNGGNGMRRIYLNDEAAEIHYFMVTDDRFGYNQQPSRWGESGGETVRFVSSSGREYWIAAGDYDCSSSTITAWRLAVQGTPYEGSLDGATYTGDMREVFVNSGLFWSELSAASRGDLYLAEGKHVAMCQDGGSDGVFGWDCLSEFNRNENHAASWGESGDQDGYESVFRGYYDDGWNTVLHYNGNGDYDVNVEPDVVVPTQPDSEPYNDLGLHYRAHVQNAGWLPAVHDGQIAGTEGFSARLEAIKITPPEGVVLDVHFHIQGYGWLAYDNVLKGECSGTDSSENDPIMGTTGESRRAEAVKVHVIQWPDYLAGKRIHLQAHCQGIGWMPPVGEGEVCGTTGQSRRLEAVRMWID